MQLSVNDVARFFNVSEKTVYRWIHKGEVPAYRLGEQYRFNRAELLEWATARRINFSPDLMAEPDDEAAPASLFDALEAGGIFYRVSGTDRPSVLKSVVDVMRLPDDADRGFLCQVLLAREALGSTAIGGGIAIPHVRQPIVLHVYRPIVTLCFLERPVDFSALDGRPVTTLFTMVTPTVRTHLALLARMAFALRDADFSAVISRQAPREEILSEAARIDDALARSGPPPGAHAS